MAAPAARHHPPNAPPAALPWPQGVRTSALGSSAARRRELAAGTSASLAPWMISTGMPWRPTARASRSAWVRWPSPCAAHGRGEQRISRVRGAGSSRGRVLRCKVIKTTCCAAVLLCGREQWAQRGRPGSQAQVQAGRPASRGQRSRPRCARLPALRRARCARSRASLQSGQRGSAGCRLPSHAPAGRSCTAGTWAERTPRQCRQCRSGPPHAPLRRASLDRLLQTALRHTSLVCLLQASRPAHTAHGQSSAGAVQTGSAPWRQGAVRISG